MWITQTYLAPVEPNAKIFIYFMYEDYVALQEQMVREVQEKLEKMGDQFGEHVSLLMPTPNSADRIEAEVREIPDLWRMLKAKLPGLLISRVPMAAKEFSLSEVYYIGLSTGLTLSTDINVNLINRVRKITSDQLDWKLRELGTKEKQLDPKYSEAIELKIGINGFKIDLKKLLSIHRSRRC